MPALFGAPVVMPQGDGRLVLFMLGINTTLYSIEQTAWSNGWSGWSSHKITASEWPPAMARNGDGRLMTFIVAEGIEFIEQTVWAGGFGVPTGLGNPPPTGQSNVPTIAAGADGKLVLMASNGFLSSLEQGTWGGAWNPAWTSYNRPPQRCSCRSSGHGSRFGGLSSAICRRRKRCPVEFAPAVSSGRLVGLDVARNRRHRVR